MGTFIQIDDSVYIDELHTSIQEVELDEDIDYEKLVGPEDRIAKVFLFTVNSNLSIFYTGSNHMDCPRCQR